MHAAGAASFYEAGPELKRRLPTSPQPRGIPPPVLEPDRGGLGSDRGGLEPEIRRIVGALGSRPRKSKLRQAILELTALRPWRPVELADVLDFDVGNLVERHLKEMVAQCLLERTHPENPSHPAQAYRSAKKEGGS